MRLVLYIIKSFPDFRVKVFYGNIWKLRESIKRHKKNNIFTHMKELLYYSYLERYGSYIGLLADIKSVPIFPHGLMGVFISNEASIGQNVVIFQQVTIGSNKIAGSKGEGAPIIGNNVYIGCGAKIIGNVNVGDNARIGANAVVVKDVPNNSVTVLRNVETIIKPGVLDNSFHPVKGRL